MAKKAKPKKGSKSSKPNKSSGKEKKPAKKNIVSKSAKSKVKNSKPTKNIKKAVQKPAAKKTKQSSKSKIVSKKKEIKKPVVKKSTDKKVVAKAVQVKNKTADTKKAILPSKEKVIKKKVEEIIPKKNIEKPIAPISKPGKRGRKKKKSGDDDDLDMDGPLDPELMELINSETKAASKKNKGPKIIKTFINPINTLPTSFDIEESKSGKIKKEPKGKFELEYVVRTSPVILFECLSTPSGLSEWFADDVNIRDGIFTFFWDGSEQKAKLLGYKDEKFIRFRWLDKADNSYFEFRIEKDELTGDISLIITDFAEEETDKETSRLLWDSQVNKLLHVLGAV